jgi:hypothetical protein
MTINPHPYVLTVAAEGRQREVLALCERERRARQATVPPRPTHPWTAQPVVEPVAMTLARLLADVRQTVFPLPSIALGCR